MSGEQIFFVTMAFLILAAITIAAQFKWMPSGVAKTILTFVAGVLIVLSLRFAALPPSWFDGSGSAFVLAVSLTAGSFLGRDEEERSFAFPLLLGMGLTLLVANVVEVIADRLWR